MNPIIEDYFVDTNTTFEESGNRIGVWRCKICSKNILTYQRDTHFYWHKADFKYKELNID